MSFVGTLIRTTTVASKRKRLQEAEPVHALARSIAQPRMEKQQFLKVVDEAIASQRVKRLVLSAFYY